MKIARAIWRALILAGLAWATYAISGSDVEAVLAILACAFLMWMGDRRRAPEE